MAFDPSTRREPPLRGATPRAARRGIVPVALLVLAAVTILPTTILLLVGLVPVVVTLIVDDSQGRYLARAVSGMTAAAMIPFVIQLWSAGHTMRVAISMVTDVYTWFAVYSAVGVAWIMYLGFPSLIASLRTLNAQRRIARLKKLQQELIAEWGPDIAETAPAPPDDAKPQAHADADADADIAHAAPASRAL